MDLNSMLYWHPLIVGLDIPQPLTEIVELDLSDEELERIVDGDISLLEPYRNELNSAAHRIGFPLFLRTDHTSGKHSWETTCYYEKGGGFSLHIRELIECSMSAGFLGLPVNAIVIREYIPMLSRFTAFSGNMPVNPERRYFIKDGEIQCRHRYWIEEAIAEWDMTCTIYGMPSLIENWRTLLAEMNEESDDEVELLSGYARQVAGAVEGYWSVDFCKARDGRWILIDMATGERSWHDESCEFYDPLMGIGIKDREDVSDGVSVSGEEQE